MPGGRQYGHADTLSHEDLTYVPASQNVDWIHAHHIFRDDDDATTIMTDEVTPKSLHIFLEVLWRSCVPPAKHTATDADDGEVGFEL